MNVETIESLNRIISGSNPIANEPRAMQDPVEETRGPMLFVVEFEESHKKLYNDYSHPIDMYNRAKNTKPGTLVFCKGDSSIAKRTIMSADDCAGDYLLCWEFYSVVEDIDIPWHHLEIPVV